VVAVRTNHAVPWPPGKRRAFPLCYRRDPVQTPISPAPASDRDLAAVGHVDLRAEITLLAAADAGVTRRGAEIAHQADLAECATPSSTTATLKPSRLKMIASDGHDQRGRFRGILSSTRQ